MGRMGAVYRGVQLTLTVISSPTLQRALVFGLKEEFTMSVENRTPHPYNEDDFDPALLAAWSRFIDYDRASIRLKRQRWLVRSIIIMLSVVTSIYAVGITYMDTPGFWKNLVLVILAALPIFTAVMISYAKEFSPILAWSVYRVGAELLRREIYLYRARVGDYDIKPSDSVPDPDALRRKRFLENIEKASNIQPIYDTDSLNNSVMREAVQQVLAGEATTPQNRQITSDISTLIKQAKDSVYQEAQTFKDPTLWRRIVLFFTRRTVHEWVAEEHASERPDGKAMGVRDDAFSELDGEAYVKLRLIPHFNWYSNRTNNDYRLLQRGKVSIWVLGGLGSLLVATSSISGWNIEPWVAVTSSMVVAMGLYLELTMVSHTFPIYNNTANKLRNLRDEWEVLLQGSAPPNDRTIKNYIMRAERTLQIEREEWMTRAIQSQTALEQKLAKSEAAISDYLPQTLNQLALAQSFRLQGDHAYNNGRYKRALVFYWESVNIYENLGNEPGMLDGLQGLVLVINALEDETTGEIQTQLDTIGTALIGAMDQMTQKLKGHPLGERPKFQHDANAIKNRLGENVYMTHLDQGRTMESQTVVDTAAKLLAVMGIDPE